LRLEIHHDGDLPARSGVGSSSAFAVGIIHALLGLQGKSLDNNLLADLAIEMEHDILRENVGWQDQIACAIGGLNYLEFSTSLSWRAESISPSKAYLEAIESRIALVYTGITRNSSGINATLLSELDKKQSLMRELVDMVDLCRNHFMTENGDLDIIGEMLDQSWNLKRILNQAATNSDLDSFYSKGKSAGAIGGKILGAGGGGFFLFWLKAGGESDFFSKFKLGNRIPIKISPQGSSIVYRSPDLGS
jgi:D-glycero-alpha-D-manno-heptose-7-phosphate kinase